jgi:hypothetical protein
MHIIANYFCCNFFVNNAMIYMRLCQSHFTIDLNIIDCNKISGFYYPCCSLLICANRKLELYVSCIVFRTGGQIGNIENVTKLGYFETTVINSNCTHEHIKILRVLKVSAALLFIILVFRDVTICSWVSIFRRFEGTVSSP